MQLSEGILSNMRRALDLAGRDTSAGWLLTAAVALEAIASDIRGEVADMTFPLVPGVTTPDETPSAGQGQENHETPTGI